MAEVFISYHVASAAHIVHKISADLEARGVSCWYSKTGVRGGEDFARIVVPEIEKCKVFLLIVEKGSIDSRHVETELKLAFERFNRNETVTIIPFQTEKCALSAWMKYYTATIQVMNKDCGPWLSALREVEKRIEHILLLQRYKRSSLSATDYNPAQSSATKSVKSERKILKRQRPANYTYDVIFEHLIGAGIPLALIFFNVLYESLRNHISFMDALKNSFWGHSVVFLVLFAIIEIGYIKR